MNILYDDTIFNLQRYGGISRYYTELIKRMRRRDDAAVGLFKDLKMIPRRFSKINDILLDHKLRRRGYDIYHPTYYAPRIQKRGSVKTVVTVYDMIHELYAGRFESFSSGSGIKKSSIANADHIICISKSTRNDLVKTYNIEDSRVSVIYLGVSLKDDEPAPAAFDGSAKPYLLYVGKRGFYKNFKILLEAFNLLGLKDTFDLACFGGEPFSKEEASEFRRLKLEDSIKRVEGSDALLAAYYKNAAIFVYPSLYEGFGLPVLEAMANGCMVIASSAGATPEIAGGSALLFTPDKVDELCSCIKEALNDEQLRSDYIRKGRERIGQFSWDKTAQETYDVYKKVLNG